MHIRITLSVLFLLAACDHSRPIATTAPKPGSPSDDARVALVAYTNALLAHDVSAMKSHLLLPTDEAARKQIEEAIEQGERPPAGMTLNAVEVEFDGPIAVGNGSYRWPDGRIEDAPTSYLVHRDGRWKVVIIYMGAGEDLLKAELEVIERRMSADGTDARS